MPAQDEPGRGRLLRHLCGWPFVLGALLVLIVGCTRPYYRNFADRDVYRILQDRDFDWRWRLPNRPVEADPRSRMGDVHDPNHEPIPPDDPGARPFQVTAGMPLEFHGWKKRGTAPIEDPRWLDYIPRQPDGTMLLSRSSAMQIALMNSRDYQFQIESVYLAALSLTLTRFQFFPQGFGNQTTLFRHFGTGTGAFNQLQLLTNEGFNWTLYTGAQLLTNFANSLVFQYDGHHFQAVTSSLLVSLTQPLLRGAWARNVTQNLSLAERGTLYAVRDFAHFRRVFYVQTVSGYLQLLTQSQTIRNQQNQVQALRRNLDEYEALVRADFIDSLQRDNIAQSYQQARLTLLQQEAGYQTNRDQYLVEQLGLPSNLPVTVDESLLKQFELNDPRLDSLRKTNDELYLSLLQYDRPPERAVILSTAEKVLDEFKALREVAGVVAGELKQWQARIVSERGRMGAGPGPIAADDRESFDRQVKLSADLATAFESSLGALADDIETTQKLIDLPVEADAEKTWLQLRQDLVGRDIRARLSELFVIQTQVRVYLIELPEVDMTVEQAISVALANRLDLMNTEAAVTDQWRIVERDANALQAGLSLSYTGQLNTDPKHLGIFRFDASNSTQAASVRFDAPINRRVERNTYRADQIQYQRERRAFMLARDEIVRAIRLDMRNLNLNRRQFEIGREALLIAARQVDSAEYNARASTGATSAASQSAGLNLLQALNGLLQAKNGLIGNWVQYETQRMGLYRDFDIMNIDDQGVWTNDRDVPTADGGGVATAPLPHRPNPESLLPLPAPTPGPFAPRP